MDIDYKDTWLSRGLIQYFSSQLLLFCVALYSHWLQGYLTFSSTDSIWVFRWFCCVNSFSHWIRGNLTFSWTDSIWVFRLLWCVNCLQHWIQGYLTFSWTDSIWVFRWFCCVNCLSHWLQGYLTFSWTHSIWVSRLHCCVNCLLHWIQENLSFKIWLLIKLFVTLRTWILDTLMHWTSMSFQISFISSAVLTLITRISYFLMNRLNMRP